MRFDYQQCSMDSGEGTQATRGRAASKPAFSNYLLPYSNPSECGCVVVWRQSASFYSASERTESNRLAMIVARYGIIE